MSPSMGLCGPSYTSQSPNLADQLTMGWYVESSEGQGQAPLVLYPTPGTEVFCDLGDTPVRGEINVNDRGFAVAGSRFYEVLANGTKIAWGNVINDDLPVSMCAGTTQILIASAGFCYVFDFSPGIISGSTLNAGGMNGIASSSLNAGGMNYNAGDLLFFPSGNGDGAAVVDTIATNGIGLNGLGAGGTGYAMGDTFTVSSGNGDAKGVVDAVSGGGIVTAYHLTAIGSGYVQGTLATTTTGAGTGLTIIVATLIVGIVATYHITSVGTGYTAGLATSTTSGAGSGFQINILTLGGGYAANDTGTVNGGSISATYIVNTVDAYGNVLTYSITAPGSGYSVIVGQTTATGGAQPGIGAGFAINITSIGTANTFMGLPGGTLLGLISFVGYCDGFFVALLANSNQFQISGVLDATSWDPTDTAKVSVFTGNVLSMIVDHREIWFYGERQTQVYYNSGAALFPFDIVPGAFIEAGIFAPQTPVRLDNSLFWLGGDERGACIVWRAQGYTPQRVSTHAIEFAFQGYLQKYGPSGVNNAVGYSYQDQGHSFYVLYFPTPSATWVYDVATNMWHQRGYWLVSNGIFQAHHSQNHMFIFGKHLVGDWGSGKIYNMSIGLYTDAGNPIRRVRRAPHISLEQQRQVHSQLQIYLESGLGPQPPLFTPSTAPRSFTLQDSSGGLWSIEILDPSGNLEAIPITSGTPILLFLNDITNPGQSWQITIDPTGMLIYAVPVAYSALYPSQYVLTSTPSGFYSLLQVNAGSLQTSVSASTADPDGRPPMINLRWSNDGGHTWSDEFPVGAGKAGEYATRVMWRRLGRARDRVYEVSCSDPIPWRLIADYLQITTGKAA